MLCNLDQNRPSEPAFTSPIPADAVGSPSLSALGEGRGRGKGEVRLLSSSPLPTIVGQTLRGILFSPAPYSVWLHTALGSVRRCAILVRIANQSLYAATQNRTSESG